MNNLFVDEFAGGLSDYAIDDALRRWYGICLDRLNFPMWKIELPETNYMPYYYVGDSNNISIKIPKGEDMCNDGCDMDRVEERQLDPTIRLISNLSRDLGAKETEVRFTTTEINTQRKRADQSELEARMLSGRVRYYEQLSADNYEREAAKVKRLTPKKVVKKSKRSKK